MPKFGDLSSIFSNTNEKFEISKFKLGYMRNFVQIRKSILFSSKHPNLDIWAQNLKDESKYKILHFPNFETLGRFGSSRNFFGLFWLVSARFGWCQAVPGFSKYGCFRPYQDKFDSPQLKLNLIYTELNWKYQLLELPNNLWHLWICGSPLKKAAKAHFVFSVLWW